MVVSQLGYIGIGVRDPGAWEQFATRVLGAEVADRDPDGTLYLRIDEHHHRLALHPGDDDDLRYIGLETPDHAAYARGTAALEAAGVRLAPGTPAEAAARRVLDLVRFEAGGLPFELCLGHQARWHPGFRPSRPMAGFTADRLGLGHIVVRSPDVPGTVRLLTGALGFRISDYINTMVFLRCNPRHHSIALQPSGPGQARSRDKRMWHFMLEARTIDDVGTALDAAVREGTPLATSLGRHSNDQMISFYMVTPSGFEVEYGWGGRLIDDATWEVQRHDRGTLWGHVPVPPAPASAPAPVASPVAAAATAAPR